MKLTSATVMAAAICCLLAALCGPSHAQTVIDEWSSIKTPPPPVVSPVIVDPGTTALLLLDFNKQTCNAERRPRCIASFPR